MNLKGGLLLKRLKGYSIQLFIICAVFFLVSISVFAQPRPAYGDPIAVYQGKEGVQIVSYTQAWGNEKALEKIYNELLNNFHGEEIHYLSHIYIYPDSPDGVDGLYYSDFEYGKNGKFVYRDDRYIELFNGDEYTKISQLARVIAHEYGHHFTYYHLITGENKLFTDWQDTEYAKIRNLSKYPQVNNFSLNDPEYVHEWDISEIAAEDYVQMFGSPLARKSKKYKDVQERVDENIVTYNYYYNDFNLHPQENLQLPLAMDVEGLYLYWLNLAGYTTRQPRLPSKPKLKVALIRDIYQGNKQYTFQWDEIKPINEAEVYEYTLVAYSKNDSNHPHPIKTVKTGEKMEAVFGGAIHVNEDGTANFIPNNYVGDYVFILFVKDQDGFIYTGDKITVSIPDPNAKTKEFKDVSADHWAYDYIMELTQKGIIEGYPDQTFKPSGTITKAEYLAMLLRTLQNVEFQKTKETGSWFADEGYYDMAVSLQLILPKDYGGSLNNFTYNQPITREEMAFMVARLLAQCDFSNDSAFEMEFEDSDLFRYPIEIQISAKYQLFKGYPDRKFKPQNNATRAEATTIIQRFIDLTGGKLKDL